MRVLIIGLGSIAYKHIKAIRSIDEDAKIYALRSSLTAPKIDGITNIYSYKDARVIRFDFAILSTPTAKHHQSILHSLDLKCPLFIEKPVSHNLEITKLLPIVKKNKTLTYVACNLRHLECIQYLKTHIDQSRPRINEINIYCGSYLPEWRKDYNFNEGYSAYSNMGGGVHLDLIHEIDYTYWLFGVPDKIHKTLRSKSNLNIDSIDYANYLLEYENYCANIVLNYYRRDYKREIEIVFDNYTWNINIAANRIKQGDTVIMESTNGIADTYEKQMRYWLRCIQNNENCFNDLEEAINVLKLAIE